MRLAPRRLFLAAAFLAQLAATPAYAALDILLTNDDGFDRPSIRALRTALIEAGHRVTLVGPARNASGISVQLTLAPLAAREVEPGVWSVEGSPATTTLFGLTAVLGGNTPDLIVSGINEGANLGPATVISGTVGAVIVATTLEDPIPGIAVSTDLVDGDPASAANAAHFANVARLTANVIGVLERRANPDLLPPRTVLNINYPPLARDRVKGVRIARQGRVPFFSVGYRGIGGDQFVPTFGPVEATGDVARSDTVLFRRGFVTIVPMDGDYTVDRTALTSRLSNLLGGLRP